VRACDAARGLQACYGLGLPKSTHRCIGFMQRLCGPGHAAPAAAMHGRFRCRCAGAHAGARRVLAAPAAIINRPQAPGFPGALAAAAPGANHNLRFERCDTARCGPWGSATTTWPGSTRWLFDRA